MSYNKINFETLAKRTRCDLEDIFKYAKSLNNNRYIIYNNNPEFAEAIAGLNLDIENIYNISKGLLVYYNMFNEVLTENIIDSTRLEEQNKILNKQIENLLQERENYKGLESKYNMLREERDRLIKELESRKKELDTKIVELDKKEEEKDKLIKILKDTLDTIDKNARALTTTRYITKYKKTERPRLGNEAPAFRRDITNDKILELHNKGLNNVQIGKEVNMTGAAIAYRLKHMNTNKEGDDNVRE